ncbi:hypothetical protein BGW39_001790, partial [Mortierella sp. 14UC]
NNEDRDDILKSTLQYRHTEDILVKVCEELNQENHVIYGEFLRVLLDPGHKAWIPSKDLDHKANPISLSLQVATTIPRAIEVSQIMIDYCIRMAKQEKDCLFVLPVLQSLHELVELQKLHTNLVLNTLRRLALIPVKEESDIINQAIVAHPLKFPWPFRKFDTRSVYECQSENPVFQAVAANGHTNQDNRVFCHDVFQASFDLLWNVPGLKLMTFWFPHAFIYTILFKCGTGSKVKVKRHDFKLEMLDNPAIKALVEFK